MALNTSLNIGMLGCGEMGAAIGGAFVAAEFGVSTPLDGRSDETRIRARECGLSEAENTEAMVAGADIVFSVLPPSQAASAAQEVARIAKAIRRPFTFVEANAVSPDTARSMAELFEGSAVRFVDGGLVGGPPGTGRRPRLYGSGYECSALKSLDTIAFDLIHLSDEIGQASGFKMAYAALTKGMNTLLTAGLLAAEEMGFLSSYVAELESSQNPLLKRAEANVPRLPADAARWTREMEEIRDTFQELGLPGGFHQAAADIMDLLANSRYGTETRRTLDRRRTMQQTIKDVSADRQRRTHKPEQEH